MFEKGSVMQYCVGYCTLKLRSTTRVYYHQAFNWSLNVYRSSINTRILNKCIFDSNPILFTFNQWSRKQVNDTYRPSQLWYATLRSSFRPHTVVIELKIFCSLVSCNNSAYKTVGMAQKNMIPGVGHWATRGYALGWPMPLLSNCFRSLNNCRVYWWNFEHVNGTW